jgi:hypothetical protein
MRLWYQKSPHLASVESPLALWTTRSRRGPPKELRLGGALNRPPFATDRLRSAESPPTHREEDANADCLSDGRSPDARTAGLDPSDDQQSPHLAQTWRAGEAPITWSPRSQRLQNSRDSRGLLIGREVDPTPAAGELRSD